MKKFEGILICTDLDGTLLRADKSISEENLAAIEHFKSEGGFFSFITGRMPCFLADMYEKIKPNAPIGCCNGGGIYDFQKGEYIYTEELRREALDMVECVDRELPEIGFQVNTFEKVYFSKENSAMKRHREVTGIPNITAHYRDVSEPMAKIVFGDENGDNILRLKALLDAHPLASSFDFIRSEYMLYEILPKGVNKGAALMRLASRLGVSPEKTVAIGDYNNDISVLRAARLGVAVSNAMPEVKAAADYVTVSNEEHAIARLIDELPSLI